MELEPNRKLFFDHLPSILDGVLVGPCSFWPGKVGCVKILLSWQWGYKFQVTARANWWEVTWIEDGGWDQDFLVIVFSMIIPLDPYWFIVFSMAIPHHKEQPLWMHGNKESILSTIFCLSNLQTGCHFTLATSHNKSTVVPGFVTPILIARSQSCT